MIDVGSAVGYLLLDTTGFKDGFKSAVSDLKVLGDKTASASDKFKGVGSTLTSIGSSLTTSVTLPLVGVGAAMVATASTYESAASKMQSATGATESEMKNLKKAMDNVYAQGFGEDFEDVADALSEVRKQMGKLSSDEMEDVTKNAIALRDTFEYEVSESVRAANTLMKNFGLTSEEAFDYIAYGAQNGLDWSDELLDTINEYSPQFKKLGLDAEDMFNIFVKGAENGAWNLDKIGDAMKEFSIRAVDLSATSIQAFQDLGFAEDFSAEFEAGGERAEIALNKVIQALRDMEDPLKQNEIGVALFGTMWEDLGPQVVTSLDTIDNKLGDVSGSMDDLNSKRYDNLEGNLSTLKNNATLLAKELGVVLLPIVNNIVIKITELVQKFRDLDEDQKELIVKIGGVVAALGPVLLVGGKVSNGIGGLLEKFGNLSSILGKTGGSFSSMGASMVKIIPIILLIIANIIALKIAWDNNLGGIQERTTSMVESIRTTLNTLKDICIEIGQSIKSLWDENFLGIQDALSYFLDRIQREIQAGLDLIVEIFDLFSNLFSGNWSGMWENLENIVGIIWDLLIENIKAKLDLIVDTIIRIGVRLYLAAQEAFNYVKDGFEYVWEQIMNWFNLAKEDPVAAIKSLGTALYNAGVDIFNSLWDGLNSVWDSISSWVSDCVDWIVSKVKFWEDESEKVSKSSGDQEGRDGSHRNGLTYVPFDGYRAELHKGEQVLTKSEAEDYRSGKSSGNTFNFYSPKPIGPREAAREFKKVEQKLAQDLI